MEQASFSSAPEPFTVYCYFVSPPSVYSGKDSCEAEVYLP